MYFHGILESAKQRVRAWAILYMPIITIVKKYNGLLSPAQRLNNKSYDDNWLVNLLVSASMNGNSSYQQIPL